MESICEFTRCIYCFKEKEDSKEACPVCGYTDGYGCLPSWWLTPGTLVKGRYIVGRDLNETNDRLVYLGWDMKQNCLVEITEYFPKKYVTRDITLTEKISCFPGMEEELEKGKQAFFEKAKIFFHCMVRVENCSMDFFNRNDTCYYVRKKDETRG